MNPIRVMLIDNEEVFRQGLAKLIDEQSHMIVVHQGMGDAEVVQKTNELKPDIVLIDSQTPTKDISILVSEIVKASPDTKVALFARTGVDITMVESLKAGARACLSKNISATDLVKSIELVSSGRIIISPIFAEKFLGEIVQGDRIETKEKMILSKRELEIVQMVVQGSSNKEIATELFITENTVKVHVKNILNKLELRNRQQLVAYAVLQNWVTLDSSTEGEAKESKTQ
jgi:DNA-binding NarL/FixJ family response regulator